MPFQDLPRLNLLGQDIRLGLFFLIPLSIHFLISLKKIDIELIKSQKILFAFLLGTLVFSIVQTLLVDLNGRSIGFLIWLICNVFFFIYVYLFKKFKWVGFSIALGQLFNSVYIVLQNYYYESIWVPPAFMGINFAGQVRSYGLMGEPSYVPILLIPAIAFFYRDKSLNLNDWQKRLILLVMTVALCFTYSRLSFLCLFVWLFVEIILNWKKAIKLLGPGLAIALFISGFQNPKFFGLKIKTTASKNRTLDKSIQNRTNHEYKKDRAVVTTGSINSRIESSKRGLKFLTLKPMGVGLGNSKKELIKYYEPIVKKERKRRNQNGLPGLPFSKRNIQGLYNIFLEVAVEIGVIGFLLFLGFTSSLIWEVFKTKDMMSLGMILSMLLAMQFAQNINMPAMWVIFTFCAGVIVKAERNINES